MGSEETNLGALGDLLNEFFDGSTSNERKRNIEQVLNHFNQQNEAWKQCVYFLSHSTNYYVYMYSLSVFENLINKRWYGVPANEKQEIRTFLNEFLMSHHTSVPVYIKNKLVKVIVDIGRLDWPQFQPDFFSNILHLLRDASTVILGVVMLQITSEEFMSSKADLNVSRRQELKGLLLNRIPTALHVLSDILDNIIQKYKALASTVTPPPSPSQGRSPYHTPLGSPGNSPGRNISPVPGETLHNTLSPQWISSSLLRRDINSSVPIVMDAASEDICISVLSCLNHLFSWVPLSNVMTPALIGKLFHFAAYGCSSVSEGASDQKSSQVGVLAMSCINEIVSKNFFPAEYENVLFKMFQQTFSLLQQLTKGNNYQLGQGLLARLDDSYLEKFTEFLYLFVSIHLKRFEPNYHFPTAEFLNLLVKYTMLQPTCDAFFACLDVWMVFLDYLTTKIESNPNEAEKTKQDVSQRYLPCLRDLLYKLLLKIQFCQNEAQLDDLDNELHENEEETEREKFIGECLEVVSKVAEIIPKEVIQEMVEVLKTNSDIYFALANHIVNNGNGGNQLNVSGDNECKKLHHALSDLATFLRGIGRLSDHFTGEVHFHETFSEAEPIVERICQSVLFGTYYKLYTFKNTYPAVFSVDLVEVHAQGLATLQAYSHWLGHYQLETQRQESSHSERFRTLVASILEATAPLFSEQVPNRILIAASHLLLSIATTVRPTFFLTLPCIQKLYESLNVTEVLSLPIDIQVIICSALSNALVLPWPLVSQDCQEWEMRVSNHKSLIVAITTEFIHLPDVSVLSTNIQDRQRYKSCIRRTCRILSGLIQCVTGEGTKPKKLVEQSTHDAIKTTLDLFPAYLSHGETAEDMLGLLLSGVQCLKVQLGTVFVQQIVERLLQLLTREQITKIVEDSNDAGYKVLEKFLKMLEFLVQEPDSSFKKFVPNLIEFALQHMLPILSKYPSPDIKLMVFHLLHQLLLHNWRYFFKSNILSKMSGDDSLANQEQFIAINKEFGHALMENDITLFRKSLEVLETLNEKYRLYYKDVFQANMLPTFLEILLGTLVSQSHNLLIEEIVVSIYNMASVNLDSFYSKFLPHFLMNSEGITDNQKSELLENFKTEQDLPSFHTIVQRFADDLRYYRTVNSSLPASSVHL